MHREYSRTPYAYKFHIIPKEHIFLTLGVVMPIVTQAVDDLMRCMFHPLGEQIVSKMVKELHLGPVFGNKVHYKSDKSHSSLSSDENNTVLLEENRLTVELVPNMNPFAIKWETSTFAHGMHGYSSKSKIYERKPFFHDEQTQVTLTEREVPANLALNFTMQFVDSVAAHATANKILSTYTNGEKIIIDDLRYEYPLPEGIYLYLLGFWKLKNGGSADGWLEHLSNMSGGRISTNINRFAVETSERQLVVRKNLGDVLGQMDFTAEKPESASTDQSTDKWLIEFSITVQFSRAHMVDMVYPIHMMNQQVPAELLVVDKELAYVPPEDSHPYFANDKYLAVMRGEISVPEKPVMIPWYDDWTVPEGSALPKLNYKPFLSIAFTLDNLVDVNGDPLPDGETVIDLENLPVSLVPEIITALQTQGEQSLYFTQAINVSVYSNDYPLEPASELILENGTILRVSNRNPYPTYRLILSEYIGKPYGTLNPFRVANATIVASLQR